MGPGGTRKMARGKMQAFAVAAGFLIVFRPQGGCFLKPLVSARPVSVIRLRSWCC